MNFAIAKRLSSILAMYWLFSLLIIAISYASQDIATSKIPDYLISRNKTSIDPDLLLSVSEVKRQLNSGSQNNPVLVDVRDNESFQKIRIPGSINMSLFAVKTKTFLKTKQIVLVNEGYGYNKLVSRIINS